MIRSISVSNFRSLGPDVRLEPSRFSVLVGPNGSGKSNILDAISFVRDAVMLGLPAAVTHRGGISDVRRHSGGRPFDISLSLELTLPSGTTATYGFVITGDKEEAYRLKSEQCRVGSESYVRENEQWRGPEGLAPRTDEQSLALTALGGDERFKELVDFLSQIMIYAIFPDVLREPQKFDPVKPMRSHGENWVSTLRELLRGEPEKNELIKGLHELTGDIDDVRVNSAAGYLVAEFKQRPSEGSRSKRRRWFNASQQSDGTLRFAGLLTALLQAPPLGVMGVEEPELTVHPGALPMLFDFLRQASEVSQIFITTHSPSILDVVDVTRDTVFVVERSDGVTQIEAAGETHLEPVRDRLMSLGELFESGELQLSLFPQSEFR